MDVGWTWGECRVDLAVGSVRSIYSFTIDH